MCGVSDLLIRRARLVPLASYDVPPDRPVDVHVVDGTVREIAPHLPWSAGSGGEEIDADGRWLIPGLWDNHVHLGQWTLMAQRLNTADARSPGEVIGHVADWIAATVPDRPVVGFGHRPAIWSEQPTVAALDRVSGEIPVVLIAGDAHHAWLNTAAQRHFGLEPREDLIRENDWFHLQDRVFELAGFDDTSPTAYRATLDVAASLGVVGLVDFEFDNSLAGWRERWAAGCDRLRIRTALYIEEIDEALSTSLRTGDPLIPGDDRLTMGPLKIISDGSLNTCTAWCHEPYASGADPAHPSGAPNLSGPDLVAHLALAHRHGLDVATHAIGDAAVTAALAAYDATGARGSIEHAQLVRRSDVRELARLGLVASVQPAHLLDDRDLTDVTWSDRADSCFAFRWLLDSGVTLALGSDAPVAPLDPWLAIDAAVRRTGDDRPAWHPEQALTRREALGASVDGQPMVRQGSRGDLVLLDDDPLRPDVPVPPVALTAVGGRVIHLAL